MRNWDNLFDVSSPSHTNVITNCCEMTCLKLTLVYYSWIGFDEIRFLIRFQISINVFYISGILYILYYILFSFKYFLTCHWNEKYLVSKINKKKNACFRSD